MLFNLVSEFFDFLFSYCFIHLNLRVPIFEYHIVKQNNGKVNQFSRRIQKIKIDKPKIVSKINYICFSNGNRNPFLDFCEKGIRWETWTVPAAVISDSAIISGSESLKTNTTFHPDTVDYVSGGGEGNQRSEKVRRPAIRLICSGVNIKCFSFEKAQNLIFLDCPDRIAIIWIWKRFWYAFYFSCDYFKSKNQFLYRR